MNGSVKKLTNYPVTLTNAVYFPNSNTKLWSFENSKLIALGDSITQSGYPQVLQRLSGIQCTNKGSSGATSTRLRTIATDININYSKYDICLIMIGHNDTTLNSSTINDIKGISDYNNYPDTYFGNVCATIEHIFSQNNLIHLFLMTPITSLNGTYYPRTIKAREHLKTIADYYNVPLIDLHTESGITRYNLNYYSDDNIHPNSKGNVVIAKRIMKSLICL